MKVQRGTTLRRLALAALVAGLAPACKADPAPSPATAREALETARPQAIAPSVAATPATARDVAKRPGTRPVRWRGRTFLARADEIIVRFRESADPRAIRALAGALGGEIAYTSPYTRARVLRLGADADVEQALEDLARSPLVELVLPNAVTVGAGKKGGGGKGGTAPPPPKWSLPPTVAPGFDPALVPYWPYEWALKAIGAAAAWDASKSLGGDVAVAVLDSGVSPVPSLPPERLRAGADFIDPGTPPDDENGHGTHMATLIAGGGTLGGNGVMTGLAPAATVVPVRVLDEDLSGTEMALVDGLHWVALTQPDVRVVNMSLTFPAGYYPSPLLTEAIDFLAAREIVMVGAAGNDGSSTVGYPARFPEVIAVGAASLEAPGVFGRAAYSNTGGALDLLAYGGDVTRDADADGLPDGLLGERPATAHGPAGAYLTAGTSPAAAQVSGLAALLLERGAPPASVRYLLHASATDGLSPGFDAESGMGLVQAGRAMADLVAGLHLDHADKPLFATPVVFFEYTKVPGAVELAARVEVQVTDDIGAKVAGADVWIHFGGVYDQVVHAVTDVRGVAAAGPAGTFHAEDGFVAVTVDAAVFPDEGLPKRPLGRVEVERLTYELASNFGTGLASSAIVLDTTSDGYRAVATWDPLRYSTTYTLRSLGTGLASSAIIFGFSPEYYASSRLWESTLLFRSGGSGLASSAIIFDEALFNPARLVDYNRDALTVTNYTRGSGLASSAILWGGMAFPYDLFFVGSNPSTFAMSSGAGLASSAILWNGPALLSPSLYLGASTLGWQATTTGTGLASSARFFDYGPTTVGQLGYDWTALTAMYPSGQGLASSALVATYDPYAYITGSRGYLDPTLWYAGRSEATVPFVAP